MIFCTCVSVSTSLFLFRIFCDYVISVFSSSSSQWHGLEYLSNANLLLSFESTFIHFDFLLLIPNIS